MTGATGSDYPLLLTACLCWLALLAGCGPHIRQVRRLNPDPGQTHFQSHCAACHQYDGQGAGDAPPLDASPWVTGPESRLIRIVLHGVRGPMVVSGVAYDREMPGFGAVLADPDAAALVSYVRRRFGGPTGAVTPEAVSRIRAADAGRTPYWSVDELLKLQ
jgi:mono/diheme cytochrome c family protein